MDQLLTEQEFALQAVQHLADLLGSRQLSASQLPHLHLLLSRATEATRALIEVIEVGGAALAK